MPIFLCNFRTKVVVRERKITVQAANLTRLSEEKGKAAKGGSLSADQGRKNPSRRVLIEPAPVWVRPGLSLGGFFKVRISVKGAR